MPKEGLDYDVVVVGAGIGGLYAVHRLRSDGLNVAAFEGAPSVGGVWYHNSYPGARVDVAGLYYCYFFDPELYREWHWKERYPSQAEILAYLNHVADRYDLRRSITLNTWVAGAHWDENAAFYRVSTDTGITVSCRYLVLATGQLSRARKPPMPGLADFRGECLRTSQWPDTPVDLANRRVAVIGTGSSGVQASTAIAEVADQLYVCQRSPHYTAPAHNGPTDPIAFADFSGRVQEVWKEITTAKAGGGFPLGEKAASGYTPSEQREQLERFWEWGGQALVGVFADQGVNNDSNRIVSDFVREKIREAIRDPGTADRLLPQYPIGCKRVAVDVGYYDIYNQSNVDLVDLRADSIDHITANGIQTKSHHYEVDVIALALGFDAFTGALDAIDIRNERSEHPTDRWRRGPQTYLGLMTRGFPNLFIMTGAGSPSVLSNMFASNVHHADFIADLIAFMASKGYARIEPSAEAETAWGAHVQEVAQPLIRFRVDNYMVHVNRDDNSRIFLPYVGGFARYVATCSEVAANGYRGFEFGAAGASRSSQAWEGFVPWDSSAVADGLDLPLLELG
jgi:cation diffusion facilitator CzcD-associated flavoprotein CzcO